MRKYAGILKQTAREFMQDKVPRLGAALSYYTLFSLAPLLLVAIAISGLVFGQEAAQKEISSQLRGVLGDNTAKGVEELVQNAAKPKTGTIATILGVVTLMMGASGVFGQLKDALNTIWDVKPKAARGIKGFVRDRFMSMAMVLGVGFLLLVSLIIDAAISAAAGRLAGGSEAAIWQAIQMAVSLVVVTVLFALIFRILPDLKIEWKDVWLGAAFTAVLFVIGKFAISLYLGRSVVGSTYGAAGSLVVVLLWVFYSAQILLFGAEFTQVYARAHGHGQEAKAVEEPEVDVTQLDRAQLNTLAASSALHPQPPVVATKQGGAMTLFVGAAAGLVVGAFIGLISGGVVLFKSLRKLLRFS